MKGVKCENSKNGKSEEDEKVMDKDQQGRKVRKLTKFEELEKEAILGRGTRT